MAVRGDLPVKRGVRSEHPKSDRGGRAGFGSPARVTLPLNFETVKNPEELAGLVQTAMDSLVNQLNTVFRDRLDKIDPRGRMLSDVYTDQAGRPIKLRKGSTDVDVNVEDVIDTVNDDLDDIPDGSTFLKVTGVSGSHQVQATSIATGAVETAKLAADAVDGTKLADNAIANEHLGTGVVGAAEIATNAVTAVKINASSVTATKIGADAVDGTKLADNAVSNEHIGSGAVSNDEIASGADISPSKVLISGSINLDDWRHSADNEKIAGSKLGNLSVDTAQIAANAVETAKINGVAVTSAKLAADSVVAGKIADNAVDSGAIFTLAIQEALIDYNNDDGPDTEAEWDAI